ncbi:MAG TPA: GlsB/YeaQ/YmgE family stress response membrane protein [Anaerolineae bacterium]|nr:GlsB/YeaQ/YmgE family stress response membrane protein [Anaerolineae bacterium]
MVLLSWIVVGAIAGWLSGQVLKGRGFGWRGFIVVGVAGGVMGGFLAVMVFNVPNAVNGLNLTSTLTAFLGAVVLIIVVRVAQGRDRGSSLRR